MPQARFGRTARSLETTDVDDLITKVRAAGIPLSECVGAKPLYGIKTGLNEAYLIDGSVKEVLTKDPKVDDLVKPLLRGQDIKRWTADWDNLWLILIKSSENYSWPWSNAGDSAEQVFADTYPTIYEHFLPLRERMLQKLDKGRYWWELRSCAYYEAFEKPKILYQEIQFHSAYCLDNAGHLTNNKVFLLANDDPYVLGVLNSPLMWWYNWRYLPHMKDEALSPSAWLLENLPIAEPTDEVRSAIGTVADRLAAVAISTQNITRSSLDWLRMEFGVENPSQKLQDLAGRSAEATAKDRRQADAQCLESAAGGVCRTSHSPARTLERQLSDMVNTAYGLTPAEVDLLWRTAPPRMPAV